MLQIFFFFLSGMRINKIKRKDVKNRREPIIKSFSNIFPGILLNAIISIFFGFLIYNNRISETEMITNDDDYGFFSSCKSIILLYQDYSSLLKLKKKVEEKFKMGKK